MGDDLALGSGIGDRMAQHRLVAGNMSAKN
jgi:hypothetical protein